VELASERPLDLEQVECVKESLSLVTPPYESDHPLKAVDLLQNRDRFDDRVFVATASKDSVFDGLGV
jgi:hypothetical protein